MRLTPIYEQALRLAVDSARPQYVCRSCQAQTIRQLHTSSSLLAKVPFWKRMQQSIFGSKEAKEAERSREERTKQRIEELSQNRESGVRPGTRTDRLGREYTVAAVIDPAINQNYVQATSWDGLESVGSEDWVKARADQGEQYAGFMSRKRLELNNSQWERLLHHITVEVLALRQAGRSLDDICNPRTSLSASWQHTRKAVIGRTDDDFGATLKAGSSVLEAIPTAADVSEDSEGTFALNEQALTTEGKEAATAGNLAQYEKPCEWMDIPMNDPLVKLAIIKRATQLSGRRIPDTAVSRGSTLHDLYHALQAKEKPMKLAQTKQIQKLKVTAPNVAVYGTRRTPIHKEKEIGRWKVIEEELLRRDLPVTGSRWQGARTTVA